ncbi:hypothetical protein [Schlesneria paludicola]|uniref:hypothetical protein n=1 Tax=Schlesneria paludicola TaxID=360056 RepID=UPI00029A7878|nr:hypothetical protein [Schlesneria paludicola]
MNERQKEVFGQQPLPSTANLKDTSVVLLSPQIAGTVIGAIVGFGLGRGVYTAVAETMEWGTIATLCVGTIILCVVGGVIGGLAQVAINFVGKDV